MLIPHLSARSQRWRDRRSTFAPNATIIDPSEFAVDVIEKRAVAKDWLSQHHYLGSMPAAKLSVGLFRNGAAGRSELTGVAVFSVPTNDASLPLHTGMPPQAATNLGRFALLDEVAGNGETWFLSRCFRILRRERPAIQAVTAYSDPTPRVGPNNLWAPGHVGQIYACSGALARGQTRPRNEFFTPDGAAFADRAINKIRRGESGWRYCVDELLRRGAPRPVNDDLGAWFDDLVATGFISRRRRAGLWVYAFPLTMAARVAAARIPTVSAPKRSTSPQGADVTALPLFAML